MPLFTPGKRWQSPFSPFHKEPLGRRLLAEIEKAVKGPLFGCRMCGNCLLQETAFICPMACPKGLRNGPCGGSTSERCYVDESRPCIWYEIYDRSFKMGRQEMLLEVLPPLDWDKVGTETWGDVWGQVRQIGVRKVFGGLTSKNPHERSHTWDAIFSPVRQPAWWAGDAKYHAPASSEPVSELERRLKAGEFVVTAEVSAPRSADASRMISHVDLIKPYVTAINFTDNSTASVHISSMASCVVAKEHGVEPVMQMTSRDHTRLTVQSEVLGASALGIHNVLCLTGDSPRIGPPPIGNVDYVDLESVQIIWVLRRMRDEGITLDGRAIKAPPKLFIGAAASPFASRPDFQAIREHKKVNAGAQFFQTNLVFDPDGFEIWLEHLARRGVLDKVYILVSVAPLKDLKMARYIHDKVPGITLPDKIMQRMEVAGDGAGEEGVQIACEIIEHVRGKQGVNGIHLIAAGWDEIIPRVVKEAGLLRADFTKPPPGAGAALPA